MQCFEDVEKCPFRIYDLDKDISFCNFYKEHARLVVDRQFARIPVLISRACNWIKKEELRLKSIVEISCKNTLYFFKNAKIGDKVYCFYGSPNDLEVKLLEKPRDLRSSRYCKCQRKSGTIFSVHIDRLRIISKANYYGEYFIEGIEKRDEKRAKDLEFQAKYYGFRAEIEEKDKGYLLKIYGDSQQEVDDFINLFIKQGFEIVS